MGMFDILGGGTRRSGGGMSPIALAVLGALAYRTLKGKGRLGEGGSMGGLTGGGLGAGLKDLLDRFRQSGHEEQAQSWVSTGANRSIEPRELEEVLGEERIQWLMEQTGMPKEQLLAGLSSELPSAVDKLTPKGELPTDNELDQQLHH